MQIEFSKSRGGVVVDQDQNQDQDLNRGLRGRRGESKVGSVGMDGMQGGKQWEGMWWMGVRSV
ncbi:hypothetical protein CH63R_05635 [Colletotrichum higginsianum IMI 349063]|uniref:Uncharacterized protein n=1 Tax=Colletotrichum higginsianum (strain IMI 349063) TaxID=759273 RepID=A0A1B7YCT9_COLHI|nr:hypothetical protein CH63R_05635 [Colletotrichum higginsianum IMI 349063]OBR09943.1 hypothetical protein CH63R_05635 [Colletotrichum higginsianum IMI 349063]